MPNTCRQLALISSSMIALLTATSAFAQAQAPDATAQPASPPLASTPPVPTDSAQPSESSPAPTAAPTGGSGPKLEEIVVTADRKHSYSADLVQAGSFRGARALDTPLTVSVIPSEVINSQQAVGLLDALKNTAGVTSAQTAPVVFNNIAIRGIAVDNRGNFRLDGALPIINLIDLPLEDKDRVEALKGASALYYGFTTPSGIINMVMKRPTVKPFLGLTVFGNNFGAIDGAVDAGGTWGIFGARINAVYGSVDYGIDHTRGRRSLISGAFDLKPTDRLTFTLDVEHIFKKVNEPGVYRYTSFPASTLANPYPSLALPPLINQKTNFGPAWARNDAEETNVLANANWKVTDAWALTLSGGISDESRTRISSTLTPTNRRINDLNNLLILIQPDATYKNRYLRAEVAGTFDTGPFNHELLVGITDNQRDQFTSNSISLNCTAANQATLAPVSAASGVHSCQQNIFNPVAVPQLAIPGRTGTLSRIADLGVYAFDRVKFHDWLQLLGGVRKSWYKESNLTLGTVTTDVKPISGSVGIVLKPKSWASIYATYIEGLETTPLAPVTAVNSGAQLPASTSQQYEGGIKLEPKRGLLFQAAYFRINRVSTYVNAQDIYVEDGRARYSGVEASLTGEITQDLSVYLSGLRLTAKQVSGAPTVVTTNPVTHVVTVSPTLVGREIENTAKWSGSVAGEYRLTRWINGLSVNGGVFYTGRRAIDAFNRAFVPGYAILNLGAAYHTSIVGHGVTFRVNGENITGKRYWASTGADLVAEGTPTTVKFSLSTSF
jgi:iron complex outermembrane receptor protein